VIATHISTYPEAAQQKLRWLRALILEVAALTPGVGPLEETLRWRELAFVARQSKSESLIRIDWKPHMPDVCSLYFICHTHLVDRFRSMYGNILTFDGNRAIVLAIRDDPVSETVAALRDCIAQALTYHSHKK
jgi:hypothetical protein